MEFENQFYKGTEIPIIEFKYLWYRSDTSRIELELTESLGYDDFDQFAKLLCKIIDAKVKCFINGPDSRICNVILRDGGEIVLVYSDFPNRGYVTSIDGKQDDFIVDLFEFLPVEKRYDYRI